MPIKKLTGRQEVIAATADFTFADVTSGTYAAAVDVPAGAIVVGGHLAITTIFNSATTDQFSIGDKVGANAAAAATYAAQSADITAPGAVPIVATGKKYAAAATVGIVWTGAGAAPSAGAGRLTVLYIVDGRAAFSQG
ncbi:MULTISPECIES: hypothetical protein [unclassified Acidovorax]|uniref:hypothetical protein n=1 Tax=unclassified Acidovorax TaxID=2684926 RepID=UPI002882D8B5|nr:MULTISPECIES: hypothetical protein [unclassified Acidovorax]